MTKLIFFIISQTDFESLMFLDLFDCIYKNRDKMNLKQKQK
ncbi:hypothetical protein HMPREF1552_01104 [Leptotrichia sp. oral taxon 879 str. F0557]|nr:hypothetical protein HMPREF1552_01104 [Leptotrichia sp. oral taxon 879 str. F0557]